MSKDTSFINSAHWDKCKDLGPIYGLSGMQLVTFENDINLLLPIGFKVSAGWSFNNHVCAHGVIIKLWHDGEFTDTWCAIMRMNTPEFLAEHMMICYERFGKGAKI